MGSSWVARSPVELVIVVEAVIYIHDGWAASSNRISAIIFAAGKVILLRGWWVIALRFNRPITFYILVGAIIAQGPTAEAIFVVYGAHVLHVLLFTDEVELTALSFDHPGIWFRAIIETLIEAGQPSVFYPTIWVEAQIWFGDYCKVVYFIVIREAGAFN